MAALETNLEEEALVFEVFAAVGPERQGEVLADAAELHRVRLQVHVRPHVRQHVICRHVKLSRLGVLWKAGYSTSGKDVRLS